MKNIPVCVGDTRVDLETACIRRPSYHARFSSVYNMKINEELKLDTYILISLIEEIKSIISQVVLIFVPWMEIIAQQ